MRVSLHVNGTPSELLVEEDALTWWRHIESSRQHDHTESPIRQLVRHLSSSSINNRSHSHEDEKNNNSHQTTPSTIVTTPSLGGHAQPIFNKKQKRIEFSHIIGIIRVPHKSEKNHQHDRGQPNKKLTNSSSSTSSSSASATSTGVSQQRDEKQQQQQTVAFTNKLRVFYAKKSNKKTSSRLLKLKKITIEAPDVGRLGQLHQDATHQTNATLLADLHDLIEQHLELKRRQRPKRLLIFVNPFGGKGRAVQLFEKKVQRVLELANIESELVVTQYANHARETLEDPDFQVHQFDGIICVGGDGMFAELMNGLLFRLNRDKLLRSTSASIDEGREAQSSSSSDLDSVEGNTSSSSTASSSPPTTTNIDEHLSASSDTKTQVIQNSENNNHSNQDKAKLSENSQCKNQEERSFAQQMQFLRSSLGGIGERFHSPSIPIGVIGAGSTDANLFGFIGTNDVISATLNIVLGNQIQIDVCSIHSIRDDRLMRFVSTFVAYGYFGDVARESERLRWLGPSRYDVTALNSLIKYRAYNGLVRILSSPRDGTPRDLERCHLDCRLCQNNISNSLSFNDFSHLSKSRDDDELDGQVGKCRSSKQQTLAKALDDLDQFEMIEKRGPFIGVNAAVTACRCPQTRKGFSPGNHLANGCADLILVRPCSRLQYINYLLRTGYTNKSAFDLKYVETHRCRQFEFIVEEASGPGDDCSPSNSNDEHSTTSGYESSSTIKQSSRESASSLGDSLVSLQDNNNNNNNKRVGVKQDLRPRNNNLESRHGTQTVNSSWNADGEILTEQSIRVKVNNKLLRVFGTGEPRQSQTKSRA